MSRFILTAEIIWETKDHLIKKGMEYLVPSHRIFNNQFSSNNYFHMLEEHCTGRITVRLRLHNSNIYSSHGQCHYLAKLNHYWRS